MKSIVRNLPFRKSHGDLDIPALTEIIEDAYQSYNTSEFVTKTTFSPSTVGYGHGRCPRYWFIAFEGAIFDKNSDPQSIANMLNGTLAHDRLGELFNRSSLDIVEIEQEIVTEDPPVRGFIDVVVNRSGEEVVGEIKTTRNVIFMHRQAKMKPAPYHIAQVLLYMWAKDVSMGFVLYENKDSHEILIIPVKREDHEEELQELLSWMRKVYQAHQDGELPTRPHKSKRSKECKGCPVRNTCWDEMESGVRDIETLPVL